MAFGQANKSSNGNGFKQFIGVGSFRVMGVNPTKDEMKVFYDRDIEKDPEYVTKKTDDKTHEEYLQARITFLIQADKVNEENEEIKANAALTEILKTNITFFIENRYEFNSDKTKVKIIDKYGRTAWATIEQAKNHQIPVYSNGPARIAPDFRPCYRGEEPLVKFIANYLNITFVDSYNKTTGQWIENANPADCECGLDCIQNYFKGDFKEVKGIAKLMPLNRVKISLAIKVSDNGNTNNIAYTDVTLRNGSTKYSYIFDAIKDAKANGKYSNVIFSDAPDGSISDIHEYKPADVKETNLEKKPADPFAQAAQNNADDPFAQAAQAAQGAAPTVNVDDPFAAAAAVSDDLPFGSVA